MRGRMKRLLQTTDISIRATAAATPSVLSPTAKRTDRMAADDDEPTRKKMRVDGRERFMRAALAMAEQALASDETPVGCVFAHDDGRILGRGMNDTNRSANASRHAELVALSQILAVHPPSILRRTDLYVTVEPCVMCASALRQYGVRAVYFGCWNDRFGGTGGVLNIHDHTPCVDRPYPVHGGIFREEAIMLLRKFYIQQNARAPEPMRKGKRELKTEIMPLNVDEK